MNILFFLNFVDSGGVGTVTRNLATQYSCDGHNVEVLCVYPLKNCKYEKKLKEKGIKVHSLSQNGFGLLSLVFIYLKSILFFLKNRQFDVVFCPGVIYAMIVLPILKIMFIKSKVIVNPHTTYSKFIKNQNKTKKAYFSLARYILPWAAKIIAETEASAKSIKSSLYINKDIKVIPNPIANEDDFNFEQDISDAPHMWLQDKNLTVFVACGRMVETKNFDFMLKVFNKLYDEDNSLRLIILGDGVEKEKLEKQTTDLNLNDVVSFEGLKSNVKQYFYHASYCWMTSVLEGFPIVLGEALSMGTSCIANDCGSGPHDILIHENQTYGLLVNGYDVQENSKIIQRYLSKPKHDRDYYRSRAKDFHVKKIASDYLSVL